MRAILALEDGSVFIGSHFGATGTEVGEACFNTSMTGYQEVLTDPSYSGQIVTMTYPLIGNYGVNPEDYESGKAQVSGFVVAELAKVPSNWRARKPWARGWKSRASSALKGWTPARSPSTCAPRAPCAPASPRS